MPPVKMEPRSNPIQQFLHTIRACAREGIQVNAWLCYGPSMGGWNSGRSGGRPIAEQALRIDLAWMLRTGRAAEGSACWGTLSWNCGGEPSGSIGYRSIMDEPGMERLELTYTRGSGDKAEQVRQTIQLTSTRLHFGGKRWWMLCPYGGGRCGKLYLPNGGDRFASRKAWRLGYRSQRIAWHDKPFERLQRLQRKLGCTEGYEQFIRRPKGMWRRTFERHESRYWQINDDCDAIFAGMMGRLGLFGDRQK